jgi:hypothetical protein
MADIVLGLLIEPWKGYCLRQWEHPRVSWFLDRCAYLLLRDEPGETLTDYKEMEQGRREISESSCPSYVQDLFYGAAPILREHQSDEQLQFSALQEQLDARKRKRNRRAVTTETKYTRLERVQKAHPNCRVQRCRVDTENIFEWAGGRYCIDECVAQYGAVETREGAYYAMDQILVAYDEKGICCFLDQEANFIASEYIHLA